MGLQKSIHVNVIYRIFKPAVFMAVILINSKNCPKISLSAAYAKHNAVFLFQQVPIDVGLRGLWLQFNIV